jgi:hypothetical protein
MGGDVLERPLRKHTKGRDKYEYYCGGWGEQRKGCERMTR